MGQTYTKNILMFIALSLIIGSCYSKKDLRDQIIGEWVFDANASRPVLEERLQLSKMTSTNQEKWNKIIQNTWGKMKFSFTKESMLLIMDQKPAESSTYKVKEAVGNKLILIDVEASKGYEKEVYVIVTFKSNVLIQVNSKSSSNNIMNSLIWKRK